MQSALIVRVILAVLTAAWSPAWCCCFQRALTPHQTQSASCHTPVAAAPVEQTQCHGHSDTSQTSPAHESPDPAPQSACACVSNPIDRSAQPAAVHPHAAFEFVLADLSPRVLTAAPVAAPLLPLEQHVPAPPASLLRLHCALLV